MDKGNFNGAMETHMSASGAKDFKMVKVYG